VKEGDWVKLASRSGETALRATLTDRVSPGVVYTTFHHPGTQANVITTDYSDWATNCPEYKVTAVQVSLSNGPTEWQKDYAAQANGRGASFRRRNEGRAGYRARRLRRPGAGPSGRERREITRALPEETPVAITVNGSTQAVMMASPADIEDFALGFALSEGIVERRTRSRASRRWRSRTGSRRGSGSADARAEALGERRRAMLGPVGCGLCGIDSLAQAMRALPVVPEAHGSTPPRSRGGRRAARPSAGPRPDARGPCRGVPAAGAGDHPCARGCGPPQRARQADRRAGARRGSASGGAFVMTSRVSVDIVQKAAMAGAGTIVSVSAPTAHALRLAEGAGITLAAFARGAQVEVFCHPHRITESTSDVA
jgi:FdhD protein